MNFIKAIKDAWQIAKFDEHAIKRVAHEKDALLNGLVITIIAGIATALGTFMLPGVIFMPIGYLIGSFIGFGILHILAKLFGGKSNFRKFFAVGLHTSLLAWIMIVPFAGMFLGTIAKIWGIVAMYFVIKNVHELSPKRSLLVLLIPIIVAFVIALIVAAVLAVAFVSLLGSMGGTRLF